MVKSVVSYKHVEWGMLKMHFSFWIGLCAEEIHVCGESAAVDFVTELMFTTGEEVEVSLRDTELLERLLTA